MSRQVRLDDDVSTMVEARQATEGGSLTENANWMLRELDRLAQEARVATHLPIVGNATSLAPTVSVAVPSRSRRARRAQPPPVRSRPTTVCPHPLLQRRGDTCGACGARIRG